MVNFLKKNDGFVPFPPKGRTTRSEKKTRDGRLSIPTSENEAEEDGLGLPHLSREQQSSSNLNPSELNVIERHLMATSSPHNTAGLKRFFSITHRGTSEQTLGTKAEVRRIDLDYDDSDLDVIQSSEDSIVAAAIKARSPYVASQQINILRRILAVMLTLVLGAGVAAVVVITVKKIHQPAASTQPYTEHYTPPEPAAEIDLWCDSSLLNSTASFATCYDACAPGLCCFQEEFATFPTMHGNVDSAEMLHTNCYIEQNSDLCSLYKPCENLITARDNVYSSDYAAVPVPPDDLSYVCSEESTKTALNGEAQCEQLCEQAACCYPEHPFSCSVTNSLDCSPYSLCWDLPFVLYSVEEVSNLKVENFTKINATNASRNDSFNS